MKKLIFVLCGVLTLTAGFSRTSCGDDGDDGQLTGNRHNAAVSMPPFKGKTLKCVKAETPSSSEKISTHFRITFQTGTQCTWSMYLQAQVYDSSAQSWVTSYLLDETYDCTYTYTDTTLALTRTNDAAKFTFTKVSDGWREGDYIYN